MNPIKRISMIKDLLTIVIPCKNEREQIQECLWYLSRQKGISGTRIIIADGSDDAESVFMLDECYFKYPRLFIQIITGGYPAKARLNGSLIANTPYILFLDADMLVRDSWMLQEVISVMQKKPFIDLLTATYKTDAKWNWVYILFNLFQKIGALIGSCFAIGGFQLWRKDAYWNAGGYKEEYLYAEDYAISKKVKNRNFFIHKTIGLYTSPRRMEKDGAVYLFIMMIKCFLNRNNEKFFKKHHNYWK